MLSSKRDVAKMVRSGKIIPKRYNKLRQSKEVIKTFTSDSDVAVRFREGSMRKYLLATLSVAALGFAGQTVLAADVDMAPAAYDWSGPYIGLQGGWSWGDVDYDIPAYAPEPPDGDVDGLVLGGYVGYNMQAIYGMVWGVEIGGNWRDVDGSDPTVPGEEFETDQEWDASAVVHLGLPVDNFMFYGLGGVTVTEITGQYDPGFSEESDTAWGWTVGAGLEGAITETVHARLEYRYADYGNADLTCSTCGPTDVDLTTHTVMLGVSYNW